MEKWFHEKFKALIGGGAVGLFAGIHFIWPLPAFGSVVIIFLMKLLGVGLFSITSAICTAFGTDLWKNKIKPFISKKKKKDE